MQLNSLLMRIAVTSAHTISKILGISYNIVSSKTIKFAWILTKNKYILILSVITILILIFVL